MKIQFLNLKKQIEGIKYKIYSSIDKNIKTSQFINGSDVRKFENEFARYLNIKYCQGVANGTDALEIALKVLNLKKNSEVIVPANTWISTAEAVINNGLNVKFVDIDETHNICLEDLNKKISKKTSAIIAVHLYGNPAKIDKISKLCKKKKLNLLKIVLSLMEQNIKELKHHYLAILQLLAFFPQKI